MKHTMAGRIGGVGGTITFCHCGLAFFEMTRYPAWDTRGREALREASEKADTRWREHAAEVGK